MTKILIVDDEAKIRELTQALETKQAWFDQISSSLS